ncbi:TPA: hypothetical protein DIV49_03335 [Candidatus Saccharibacteria bacterium]|nr:hypothetical protein [Candidatus Saccharibacteria bacterium]HRJ91222.1 SsgA family sporulation/cell division regulator [Candidatus Saccharibacteria bacterium]
MSEIPHRGGDLPTPVPNVERLFHAASYTSEGYRAFHDVSFRYSPDDPCALHLTHMVQGGETTWVFAIDLLEAGLYDEVGEGDVRISPADVLPIPEVRIDYFSNTGNFSSFYPLGEIEAFLETVNTRYPRPVRDTSLAEAFSEIVPETWYRGL